jgi:surfactin synthase thioesterase subunit
MPEPDNDRTSTGPSPFAGALLSRRKRPMRVFCFPFAGGNAEMFNTWHRHFPDDVQVFPVHLPGRPPRMREAAFTKLDALVAAVADMLRPLLREPFALFGHSMGGLVAFELARLLSKRSAVTPTALFVSACRAPHVPSREPPMHRLADEAFVERLRAIGGTDVEVAENRELMELLLPTLRADFEVVETYVPPAGRHALTCPLTVFGGIDDRLVLPDDLDAWRDQTTGDFTRIMYPGDHFYFAAVRQSLCRVMADHLLGARVRGRDPAADVGMWDD